MLERSHPPIKQAFKIETGEQRSLCHKYVSTAVLNYNTSYHTSIGSEPSWVLRGCIPDNVLDRKLSIHPQQLPIPTSQNADDLLDQTELIYPEFRKNSMQAYIKYKAFYDKKANAPKLKKAEYVYVLQTEADHRGNKIPSTEFQWIGPYIIEEVLSNNKYLLRKVGTNKTQMLHCVRLRQFTPRQPLPDVQITPQEWNSDPEVIIKHDDLYARV